MQLNHYTSNFKKKQFPITLVCDNVTNAPNVGSLFRTADAFGVEHIIFCGSAIPRGRKMTKTSRSAEKAVNFQEIEHIENAITDLKLKGYYCVALEITSKSTNLMSFTFPKQKPLALIIGDENFGISQAVLDAMDHVVHIEMFGQNSSMNVVQATSITLYEMTKQLS